MRAGRGRVVAALALLALVSTDGAASPGWGLQVDVRDNVYFVGPDQVHRVDDAGRLTVAIPGLHAHDLYLDENERLVVLGDPAQGGEAYRLAADGTRAALSTEALAEALAVPVELLAALPDTRGAVIGDGGGGLLVAADGQVRLLRAGKEPELVLGETAGYPEVPGSDALTGLSLAFNGDLFVVDGERRRLMRLDRDTGEVVTVLSPPFAWDLLGVHVSGTYLYLLEASRLPWSSERRVRRMDSNGQTTIVARLR